MKWQSAVLVGLVLTAGTASAQGYGSFSPGGRAPATATSPGFALPTTPSAPRRPATPSSESGTAAGGFKPYEPFKGSSVYATPKPAESGAKPCETSVYVNACGHRH